MKKTSFLLSSLLFTGALGLVACGKSTSEKKPTSETAPPRAFEVAERNQLIQDLGLDLKIHVSIDAKLGVEDEFFVNHSLRILDRNRERIRKQSERVGLIILGAEFGENKLPSKRLGLNIAVRSSESEIVEFIETSGRSYARVRALDEIATKLKFKGGVTDLVGLTGEEIAAFGSKLETAFRGIPLEHSPVGVLITDRNSILLGATGADPTFLAFDHRQATEDLTMEVTKSLAMATRTNGALIGLRAKVPYGVFVSGGEFNADEMSKVGDFIEALRSTPGIELAQRKTFRKLFIGRRHESLMGPLPAQELIAVVDFESSPSSVVSFLEQMPLTIREEKDLAHANFQRALQAGLSSVVTVKPDESFDKLDAVALQNTYGALLPILSYERWTKLGFEIVRITTADKAHSIDAKTLEVSTVRLAQLGGFLDGIIEQRRREEVTTTCLRTIAGLRSPPPFAKISVRNAAYFCRYETAEASLRQISSALELIRTESTEALVTRWQLKNLYIDYDNVLKITPQEYRDDGSGWGDGEFYVGLSGLKAGDIAKAFSDKLSARNTLVEKDLLNRVTTLETHLTWGEKKARLVDNSKKERSDENYVAFLRFFHGVRQSLACDRSKKLGLEILEIAEAGVAPTWVAASKKLVLSIQLPAQEQIDAVLRREIERRGGKFECGE